ncbi:MAG TPA: hypothetical protein VHX86_04565 [Tepidisphaeraceae bacterium]|jgi:hypothetical protein|nr:hypothetical protein [Tepidisphaeraceae bacterium]
MNCLIEPADQMFDQRLFTTVAPRSGETIRSFVAASLFDLPAQPGRVRRSEPRARREEDSERWDGLS